MRKLKWGWIFKAFVEFLEWWVICWGLNALFMNWMLMYPTKELAIYMGAMVGGLEAPMMFTFWRMTNHNIKGE